MKANENKAFTSLKATKEEEFEESSALKGFTSS